MRCLLTKLRMNDSFSSTIAASQDTDNGRLSKSMTTQDEDNSVGGMSRKPLKAGSGNQGMIFDIAWDKICLSNKDRAIDCGSVGYRILHRRQHGGRGRVAVPWEFGAELMYQESGIPGNGKRFWLCRACHLSNQHQGSFLDASGFKAIYGHLLKHHKISKDGKNLVVKPGPLEKHLQQSSYNHDFYQGKQRLVVSAFPDWVIVMNLSFEQATSSITIAMFQLLRGGTKALFYTSAK